PMRHVLTQAFGAGCARVVPDVRQWALRDSDCLLLCTDGLTNLVAEPAIAAALAAGGPAGQTCRGLIDQALEAGGTDNVTAGVARYRSPPETWGRRGVEGGHAILWVGAAAVPYVALSFGPQKCRPREVLPMTTRAVLLVTVLLVGDGVAGRPAPAVPRSVTLDDGERLPLDSEGLL